VIGPFDFDFRATELQKDTIKPALEEMATIVGDRLKPITLVPKTAQQMPDYAPGLHAYGVWKGWVTKNNRREIWYWDEVDRYRVRPTIQHEGMHAFDSHAMDEAKRAEVMALMAPKPLKWTSGRYWGKYPYECYAVFGSAALFGIVYPPYATLLDRKIVDLTALKEILLRVGPPEAPPMSKPTRG
jgi:hypothetical protein